MADSLRSRVIKLAHSKPELRPFLLPILKTAFGAESEEFVDWAMLRAKKYSEDEVQKVLEHLQVPMRENVEKKSGPLAIGEQVQVDVNNNANEMNKDTCREYHMETGRVVAVDSSGTKSYSVQMDKDHKTVIFYGVKPGKETGLKRYTPPAAGMDPSQASRANVECIYLKDEKAKPSDKTRKEIANGYIQKGESKGENRSMNYYSGPVKFMAVGKTTHQLYFFMDALQRGPTNINPVSGTVLYIGRVGNRPNAWVREFEEMLKDMGEVD